MEGDRDGDRQKGGKDTGRQTDRQTDRQGRQGERKTDRYLSHTKQQCDSVVEVGVGAAGVDPEVPENREQS